MGNPRSRNDGRQPGAVVTLVHGTFARDAAWTRPDSALSKALAEAGFQVTRFGWSGRNSHRARSRAAQQLAEHLSQRIKDNPHARQWLVAHSHGGNVALHASREVRQSRNRTVRVSTVTLATPFIHAGTRVRSGWLVFVTVLFGPLLLVGAGGKAVAGPHSFLDWALIVFGALFAAEVGLCTVGALMHRRVLGPGYRDRLVASIQAPAVESEDLVAIRAAGDEASGFLVAGQFVGWMSAVLSRLLTNLIFWAFIILAVQLSVLASSVLGGGFRFVLAMMYLFATVGLVVVATVAVMLGASMVFGADGPFLAIFASTSAEAAPPGQATLLQLQPFPKTSRKGLAHSMLYDNDQVIASIVEAIRKSSPDRSTASEVLRDAQEPTAENAQRPTEQTKARIPSHGRDPVRHQRKRR